MIRQGTSPRQLAWSLTLSLLFGLFPLIGTCNIILAFLAIRFKLNLALMLAVSYLVYPLQIALFVPFVRLGERLFGVGPSGLTWEIIKASFQQNMWETVKGFSWTLLYASTGWLAISVAVIALLRALLIPLVKLFSRKHPSPDRQSREHEILS